MLAAVPAGESPAGGECPDAAVAISGNVEGDRHVESPDVNVSGAGETRSDPPRRLATRQAVTKCEPVKPRNSFPPEADGVGYRERRAVSLLAKANVVGE